MRRVVALGLDAGDSILLHRWAAQGHLPAFRSLLDQGAWRDLDNMKFHCDDTSWTSFFTGCLPGKTGYWSALKLRPGTYHIDNSGYYDSEDCPPFFTLIPSSRVAVFDLPNLHTLYPNVNGVQITGWGAHSHFDHGASLPEGLFSELVGKHGKHPAARLQYVGLNWWNRSFLKRTEEGTLEGLRRRSSICLDLLRRDLWDLFLTVYGEPHNSAHHFWHFCDPDHPLHRQDPLFPEDPLLNVYRAVDASVEALLAEIPEETYVVLFALHGAKANNIDLPAMLFLPEFLYRLSFPGKGLFPIGEPGTPCSLVIDSLDHKHWSSDIWSRRVDAHSPVSLLRPFSDHTEFDPDKPPTAAVDKVFHFAGRILEGLRRRVAVRLTDLNTGPGGWCPAMWYKATWPHMKAFALPSYSDGCIRINVKGREPKGIVDPADYHRVCDELMEELGRLTNPRTGEPFIDDIWKTRRSPDEGDHLPDGDLVVTFSDSPADVVDSPTVGRMGPFPLLRVGGHRDQGFLLARGPGIAAAATLPKGHVVDLPPTILTLMGETVPPHLDGKPLFNVAEDQDSSRPPSSST